MSITIVLIWVTVCIIIAMFTDVTIVTIGFLFGTMALAMFAVQITHHLPAKPILPPAHIIKKSQSVKSKSNTGNTEKPAGVKGGK